MTDQDTRMVALPAKEAEYVDALVASGAYASAGEVIRAGLHALQEREATIDRWLKEKVVPVFDAIQLEPRRAISAGEVTAALDSHHQERLKSRKRGT